MVRAHWLAVALHYPKVNRDDIDATMGAVGTTAGAASLLGSAAIKKIAGRGAVPVAIYFITTEDVLKTYELSIAIGGLGQDSMAMVDSQIKTISSKGRLTRSRIIKGQPLGRPRTAKSMHGVGR